MESFEAAWRQRHEYTVAVAEPYTDSDWAKGRETYLTFLIPVNDYIVTDALTALQDELEDVPCIDLFPAPYFHVTVRGVGFVRKNGEYADDVHPGEVDRIIEQAANLLRYVHPFTIRVKKMNLFPDAVFAEVHDNGKVSEVNAALQQVDRLPPWQFDAPHLLPHISIARFQNREGVVTLLERLEEHREWDAGLTTVDTVHLAEVDLTGEHPAWEPVHTFRL